MISPVTFSPPELMSVVFSLSLILVFLAISAFIAKKLRSTKSRLSVLKSSSIEIIASRSLGWNSSLLIIEAQGERFLISNGRSGITAIGLLNKNSIIEPGGPT